MRQCGLRLESNGIGSSRCDYGFSLRMLGSVNLMFCSVNFKDSFPSALCGFPHRAQR